MLKINIGKSESKSRPMKFCDLEGLCINDVNLVSHMVLEAFVYITLVFLS